MVNNKMKKTYNQPTCLVVELGSRDSLLVTLSSTDSTNGLSGVGYGGTTSSGAGGAGISEGDVKGMTDVNLWDDEW